MHQIADQDHHAGPIVVGGGARGRAPVEFGGDLVECLDQLACSIGRNETYGVVDAIQCAATCRGVFDDDQAYVESGEAIDDSQQDGCKRLLDAGTP